MQRSAIASWLISMRVFRENGDSSLQQSVKLPLDHFSWNAPLCGHCHEKILLGRGSVPVGTLYFNQSDLLALYLPDHQVRTSAREPGFLIELTQRLRDEVL